jgi:hypothetical protein
VLISHPFLYSFYIVEKERKFDKDYLILISWFIREQFNHFTSELETQAGKKKKLKKDGISMLDHLTQYDITFITPSKKDNGVLKPTFRQAYSCIPIRITIPRHSPTTLPPNPRIVVAGFVAKVHYGAGCHCESAIFETFGLSTVVDSDGFREIRGSHMSKWMGFKEGATLRVAGGGHDYFYGPHQHASVDNRKLNWCGRGMLMKASTPKTGVVEVRNMVWHVPGVYKIAFELQFDSGQPVGWTPWQTVEVQRVRKNDQRWQKSKEEMFIVYD